MFITVQSSFNLSRRAHDEEVRSKMIEHTRQNSELESPRPYRCHVHGLIATPPDHPRWQQQPDLEVSGCQCLANGSTAGCRILGLRADTAHLTSTIFDVKVRWEARRRSSHM